ncbi:MAG: PAS domain S-box protein [bacterium]
MKKKTFKIADSFILTGVILGILFWISQSALYTFLFNGRSFIEAILYPTTQEFWIRTGIISILLIIGCYMQWISSKRRYTEKQIQKERDKAQEYLDVAGIMYVVINEEKQVTYVNKKGCEILGYREEEIIGLNWCDTFISESVRDDIERLLDNMISGKRKHATYFECAVINKNKGENIIAWHNTVMKEKKGADTSILCFGEDITSRTLTEKALKEKELRLRTLFEETPNPILVINQNRRYIDANSAALRFLECSREELITKSTWDFIPYTDSGRKKSYIFQGKRSLEIDFLVKGHIKTLLLNIVPLSISNQTISYCIGQDITESKLAKEALHKTIPIPSYTWKKKGNDFILIDFNDAAKTITNGKIADFLGTSVREMYADMPDVFDHFHYCFKGKTSIKREGLFKLGSIGESKYFTITYAFVPPDLVMVHTENITERKKAEEELQKSEKKYRTLYSSMNEGVALHKILYSNTGQPIDYIILDVNQAYETIVGIERVRLIGKNASEIYNSKPPPYLDIYANVASSGHSTSFETYFSPLDKYLIISVFSPEKEQCATVFTDINKRKQMEKALMESEAKYSTLVEQARDGVFIVQDKHLQFLNKAMTEITGYTARELIGQPFSHILAQISKEQISQRYKLRLAGEEVPSCYETKFKCKDKSVKEVEVSLGLIHYHGKPAVMGIARNISERKKIQKELHKAQRLESLGFLAGGIAHDFNNLLTSIMGNLSLAELYSHNGGNVIEVLSKAKKASNQAKMLTQQLLTFSKGGAPIKKVASISSLLKNTASFTLSNSQIKLTLLIPDDLWWIKIDEAQIVQTIHNLIINAEQSMSKGGTITISAENITIGVKDCVPLNDGHYIKISITDEGSGIKEEHLSKIFDPYFTTKPKGTGLGLAITYSIIKNHEGHIIAESEMGVGTTFHIYLPALEKRIFKEPKPKREIVRHSKGNILLMDDYQNLREMIGEMLGYLGYNVKHAKNGYEAIALFKDAKDSPQAFDAVILDLTVPGGVSGEEVMREILQIDPTAKGIVSSGYSNNPVMSKFKQYGFCGVVVKPYGITELSETLDKVINGEKVS